MGGEWWVVWCSIVNVTVLPGMVRTYSTDSEAAGLAAIQSFGLLPAVGLTFPPQGWRLQSQASAKKCPFSSPNEEALVASQLNPLWDYSG